MDDTLTNTCLHGSPLPILRSMCNMRPIVIIHPAHYAQEEEIEQLSLDFTAHSNNQLSSSKVIDFMQFILLHHKDPLVLRVSAVRTLLY